MKTPITRGQIRTLLKLQNGRCAISGEKLDPKDVSIDHIISISAKKQKGNLDFGKVWLVKSDVNRMKGSFDLDYFYNLVSKIYKNKKNTLKIKKLLNSKKLTEMSREDFEKYIKKNYSEKGIIKK